VTTAMINMCAVWKNRRRDDDDTRRHAGTTRMRRRSAPASKYVKKDKDAQQPSPDTSRIGIGGPHRRNGQIHQSTRR
jgi:hypothetical protein